MVEREEKIDDEIRNRQCTARRSPCCLERTPDTPLRLATTSSDLRRSSRIEQRWL